MTSLIAHPSNPNASGGCVYGETLVTLLTHELRIINVNAGAVKPDQQLLTRNTETNKVELIDYQNWSKIKVKNQIGYVYERFITVN